MTDEQLEAYIPLYGDRLAVKDFCRRHNGISSKEARKTNLLTKIRNRLRLKKSELNDRQRGSSSSSDLKGNTNAAKSTRRIELGWMYIENGKTRQVREKTGGGTRHLTVVKTLTMEGLLSTAKTLFFPNGKSVRGSMDEFVVTLKDFKCQSVIDHTTVEHEYERSKLKMLRFYMFTERNTLASTDDVETTSLPSLEEEHLDTSFPSYFERDETVETSKENTMLNPIGDISLVSRDSEVHFRNTDAGDSSARSLDATLPYQEPEKSTFALRVHRGHALKEMIQQFSNPDVVDATTFDVTHVLPNGQEEKASGDGVFRDCITGFWTEFIDQCCVGNQEKIPVIRHDFQTKEWTAVARIVLKGYQCLKYFPAFLSASVITEAMYGKQVSSLLDNFMKYITDVENKLFIMALQNFESVDQDDLMDALDNHKCRSYVTKDTLPKILEEIAHKELVQEPKFIVNCWADVLKDLGSVISSDRLKEMYTEMEPTPKKVLKLIKFPENMSLPEAEVANHARRFIRELDKPLLKNFLRFCTGSDLLIADLGQITVEFVTLDGLQRRPIGRTCGRVLQLPRNYESFTIFRNEFKNVLSSDIWLMDIV